MKTILVVLVIFTFMTMSSIIVSSSSSTEEVTTTQVTEVTDWTSYEKILNDKHVTLIQYYSGTNKDCKNCEAFQTQWKSLQNEFTGVKFAQVDVDTEEGEDTAARTGALVGIPHVRLQYHGSDYYSLMDENITPNDQMIELIERELEDHEKDDDGMYLKTFQSVDL